MEYLIAVDLEGIHGVVGEEMKTLTDSFDYADAIEGATLEVNTAIRALFDCGATKVAVWDNHGGGNNLDFSMIDSRAIPVTGRYDKDRFDFVNEHNFSAVIFLGYHAKAGTLSGVLAHTYSSKNIQYVKLNGKAVGELAVDSYICAAHGIYPLLASSDAAGISEMKEICPSAETVVTKYGKSRNEATFKSREQVLREIYVSICRSIKLGSVNKVSGFPQSASLEIRYTRAERAYRIFKRVSAEGTVPVKYGEDAHILHFEIDSPQQIIKLL